MKKVSKKMHLVLQGPILSCGITGAQDGKIVKYDCRENIAKIIEFNNEHKIFGSIILSLWDNDPFREYDFGPVAKKLYRINLVKFIIEELMEESR